MSQCECSQHEMRGHLECCDGSSVEIALRCSGCGNVWQPEEPLPPRLWAFAVLEALGISVQEEDQCGR